MSSPISQIPAEILSDIFTYCIPETLRSSKTIAPLTFSQVSSYWRSVALETPHLWSSLSIAIPPDLAATYEDFDDIMNSLMPYETIAKTWLSRTGSLIPVSIELDVEDYDKEAVEPYLFYLSGLSLFLSSILDLYIYRLQSLTLKGHTCGVILYDLDTMPHPADIDTEPEISPTCYSLEQVNLIGSEEIYDHWLVKRLGTIFKYAPKLRRAIISNPLNWVSIDTIALPYNRFTHLLLSIEEITFFDWREIMVQCTNLVWGGFVFQRPGMYEFNRWLETEIYSIDFPHLTHLHLVCRSKFFGQFLRGFTCIEWTPESERELYRLARPVRKFFLDFPGTGLVSSDLIRLFKAIPEVEEIYFQIHRMDHRELFKALMPTSTNDILPRLILLSIYFCDMSRPIALSFPSFPEEQFVDLIASRWDGPSRHFEARGQTSRLEKVILHIWDSEASPDNFTVLDRFKREGMKATVKMIAEKVRWKERLDIELQKSGWGDGVRLVNYTND
ncbi:hypothetical protein BDQ17DRAFT_1342615 [Cyathus striatus]|nr:hypothetical protein BDQ17DRAFT_1342615 [Cyathus striatus]